MDQREQGVVDMSGSWGIRALGAMALLGCSAGLFAETPSRLEDLVGARAAGAENAMQERGYELLRSEAADGARYMYWQRPRSGECVIVRVADGRYASITGAPDFDCEQAAGEPTAGPVPKNGFETVCGVTVEGRPYRYRCVVSGARPGKNGEKTVLRFPDQTLTLEWRKGDTVRLHFEGMNPANTRFSTYEGETQFEFEGKTYFYVSNRDLAEREVRSLRER